MSEHADTSEDLKHYYGGAVSYMGGSSWAANDTDTYESFNPYEVDSQSSREIMEDRNLLLDIVLREDLENEWAILVIEYLVAEFFTAIDFIGEGEKEVKEFFANNPTARTEIIKMGRNAIRDGLGAIRKGTLPDGKRPKLMQIKALGRSINLSRLRSNDMTPDEKRLAKEQIDEDVSFNDGDEFLKLQVGSNDGGLSLIFKDWGWRADSEWGNTQGGYIVFKDINPEWEEGVGFLAPTIHALKSLKFVNRQLIAALAAFLAEINIIGANLEGISGDTARKAACDGLASSFADLKVATRAAVAMDKEHVVYRVGSGFEGGSGNSGARVLNLMEHIEPVLSSWLMTMFMAIGLIEQTGANKSLILRQEKRAERDMEAYRQVVNSFYKRFIFPSITDKPCEVVHKSLLDTEDIINGYVGGLLSREKGQDLMRVSDDGKHFSDTAQQNERMVPRSMDKGDSQEDRTAGKRA